MTIDIRKYPEIIELINAALSNKSTIELKPEAKGIAVVETGRIFKAKYEYREADK